MVVGFLWYRMDGYENIGGNLIHVTAIVHPSYVVLGKGNIIGPYAVIGEAGEQRGKHPKDFKGKVVIGDNNRISEHVTIQRPFESNQNTKIGDGNFIMAHSHIGHDSQIGNNNELCTNTIVGGYCNIKDDVKIKLSTVIRNRITIHSGATIGMGSVVVSDVNKNTLIYGNPAKEK